MKKRIIRLAIGLTSLIASFLPQKAEADFCSIECPNDSCSAIGTQVECICDAYGNSVCSS